MTTSSSPTFFDSLKKSFADVPIGTANDNAIPTSDFLEAAESLCSLFGRYYLFTPLKNDMLGNVKVGLLPACYIYAEPGALTESKRPTAGRPSGIGQPTVSGRSRIEGEEAYRNRGIAMACSVRPCSHWISGNANVVQWA